MQFKIGIKNLLVIVTICFGMNSVWASENQGKSREEVRKIMDSCFQSAGLTKPALGERPTAPTSEQSLAIDTCLKENNVQPPTRREGHGGGRGFPLPRSAAVQ